METELELREERREAVVVAAEHLFEFFVDGSSPIRIVIADVPEDEWQEIAGSLVRRYPDGDVKVVAIVSGLELEFVRARAETIPPRTIPVEEPERLT
jgi:hypothetical protein